MSQPYREPAAHSALPAVAPGAARPDLLDALNGVALAALQELDPQGVFSAVAAGLGRLGIGCALLSAFGEEPQFLLGQQSLHPALRASEPLISPGLAACVRESRPAFFAADESPLAATLPRAARPEAAQAVRRPSIAAPMPGNQDVQIVLLAAGEPLTPEDVPAVQAFANQVGAALSNAVLHQQVQSANRGLERRVQERTRELSTLHRLSQSLGRCLGSAEAIRECVAALVDAVPLDAAAAVICSRETHHCHVFSGDADTASLLARRAVDSLTTRTPGHAACMLGGIEHAAVPGGRAPAAGDLRASLEAPIQDGDRVLGVLAVYAGRPGAFTPEHRRTVETVALQLGATLERLAASQSSELARLESVIESLSEGIIVLDQAGRCQSMNATARELLRRVLGREETDDLAGSSLGPIIGHALRGEADSDELVVEDETFRTYVRAAAAPYTGIDGRPGAVLTLRDITEERLIQERLLQSEKMASVGQLVSGVAHELNNPLAGISGFAQLLLTMPLDEEARRHVQTIQDEADRATRIVQNLLSFARRRRPEKTLVDVNATLDRILELRSYELHVHDITVVREYDPNLPPTLADPHQLQQVFLNVIRNAEQAIMGHAERGTITVKTGHQRGHVVVSISDDGPGIPEEHLRRVFDPFFTTKDVGQGTGLGLSICYGIVDEHNGRITAGNRPGGGAVFTIELPVARGTPAAPAEAAPPEETAAPATGAVLVVDDEETIQGLLTGVLTLDGHRVEAVGNGRLALERLEQGAFDLIITDIKMPDLDGIGLYQAIQERWPHLRDRVIFTTGDTVSRATRDFLQSAGNPVLAKPFKIREVRELVNRVLHPEREG